MEDSPIPNKIQEALASPGTFLTQGSCQAPYHLPGLGKHCSKVNTVENNPPQRGIHHRHSFRWGLCERRGWHVTLLPCLPCRHPFSPDGSKNLPTALRKSCLPACSVRIPKQFGDELRSPTTVSPLQVPAHPSRARPRIYTPHLRSRSATRPRPLVVQFTSRKWA
ncbi:hypothetical protein BJV77DRAFT_140758 [Russula vinacea]|nr:hypothetical protein BJV77DRAFT_140758 [Russula vinacea]